MKPTTYEDFQKYIWDRLPMRKHFTGRERAMDVLAVVIQEWPDEALSETRSGDTGEVKLMEGLTKSVKRHLALVYGDRDFGSIWIMLLSVLVAQIIKLVLEWWWRDHKNQGRLRIWRRKWVNG